MWAALPHFGGNKLVRHTPADFHPTAALDSYEKYRNACELIEHHLGFKEPDAGQHAFVTDGCEVMAKPPRLLEPLDAMREAFHRASRNSKTIDQRVVRLVRASDGRITRPIELYSLPVSWVPPGFCQAPFPLRAVGCLITPHIFSIRYHGTIH